MITIEPRGKVYLCKTKLENDYKNELKFSTLQAQESYFNSVIAHSYNTNDFTYIKKDGVIKVCENIEKLIDCNYLFYRNDGFTDASGNIKTYYCFITNMEYINENCTAIYIETDVFQTYQFDIEYKMSFVQREHTNTDTIGLNTYPENLETGEYIVDGYSYFDGLDDLKYVIQCTEWATSSTKPLATNYGGVYMAGGAYVCSNITEVVNILQAFATAGKSDAVYNVYMVPSAMIDTTTGQLQYDGQSEPNLLTKNVTKTNIIDGYTPKNKKLLTFPYRYLLVSNNSGSSNIYHYERFGGDTCNFIIKGVPTVGASIKLYPSNYDRNNNTEEEGLIAGKFPTLNWSTDEYTNWLTQNSVNIALGVASSGLNIIGGIGMMATGGGAIAGASSVVSGSLSIANELGTIYQHSLQPNSARGSVNAGDINVCSQKNGFYFYDMSIKQEYAIKIDSYFNMFGYATNLVKVPNLTGRRNWNYVKTLECNFDGDIPQVYLQKIRSIFNNGITLWHNANTFLDYSQDNSIIS